MASAPHSLPCAIRWLQPPRPHLHALIFPLQAFNSLGWIIVKIAFVLRLAHR